MDIYSYLNSKDVAEYCRSLDYKFNAIETAFIVNACRHISLEEKLRLFQEIIDTMPDESLREKASRLQSYMEHEQRIKTDSFHEALSHYIVAMQKDLNEFLTAEPDTVYSWVCWYRDWDDGIDRNELYSTFDAAKTAVMAEINDWLEDYSDLSGFTGMIWKRRIDTKERCHAALNGNGLLTNLYDNHDDSCFFQWIWIKIPVPFKKGDLLYGTNPHTLDNLNIGKEPMVLIHDCCDDLDENDPKHRRLMAARDASDMTAWGYWLDGTGRLYDECMHNYHELEYYRGEIKGDVRLLKALSAQMKGEITVHMFLIAFDALQHEREMNAVFPGWDYMPECYEKSGIADIHKKYEMWEKYDREQKKE